MLLPAVAFAAVPTAEFNIPAEPLSSALVDFGLQAGVSVGANDAQSCGRTSRALSGRYTASEGLGRLLAGTRCTFEAVDARTYRVVKLPPAPVAMNPPLRRLSPTATVDQPSEVSLAITVTATKRPSLIDRTPASIGIASSRSLRAGRIQSLSDITAEFAGVTSTNLGPGRNKVFIRGLSDGAFTGRTQSTVGLYLDDVPITYAAPDPDLRLIDIDRVELVRGPQGTLYGVGSMGGIVRIITRKPDLSAVDGGIAVGGAVTQWGKPSNSIDSMINIPLIKDRLGVRAVAYREIAGGYIDDVKLGLKDVNQTKRWGGRLSAALAFNADWQLTAGLTYQSLKSADTQYADPSVGPRARANNVREPHENNFLQGFNILEGGGDWGRMKLSTAYVIHEYDSRYDASLALPLFGEPAGPGVFNEDNRVRLAVAEATYTSPAGRKLQVLLGGYASGTISDSKLNLGALQAAGRKALYWETRRDRLGEVALYGEGSYHMTRNLILTAGLRVFHSWLYTTSSVIQPPATRNFSDYTSTNDLSPKLVLSWQVSPKVLTYLQASEGYRVGGFNTSGRIGQLFTAAASGHQPNRKFKPDELWSLEAGVKASAWRSRLQFRAAAYYADWQNIQSDQFLPSGLPFTANVGRGANIGLELEAGFQVDQQLSVKANLLVNGPELTKRDPTYSARANASLPAVPAHSASVILDYRRILNQKLSAFAHARVAYVGSSVLTFEEMGQTPSMGNYITGRLSAGLETNRWRLTFYVDNPTDATGDTFAFGDPFALGHIQQVTPLTPRTVGMNLAFGM